MITIKTDFKAALKMLKNVSDSIPSITAKSLTQVAKITQKETYAEMRSNFDRPTPFVMRGLRIKVAEKTDSPIEAQVFVKDFPIAGHKLVSDQYQSGLASSIGHEFGGGARQRKLLEIRLQRHGFITSSEYLVPGQAAKLDAYGNMSRGQIQQILSQIGVTQAGADNLASQSKRSQRSQKKAGTIFWSDGSRRGHNGNLPKGAWVSTNGGLRIKALLIVVRKPQYKQRIDMQAIADRVMRRDFDRLYAKALQDKINKIV